ncbi:hypothetical protein K3X13_03850 [Aliiroseovarius crassostreae]|uniref:hypothetical protein n=1 Tax=Aliiroseovarius crassostreae TaxID=154981 RepID=UPI00220F6378|nr:hypothetical protein [Aliiroseovarius crassostreae]UWP92996.1 hypothetical protein K3X13_03850 [Aliiroseovarius crassostreae]
MTDINHNSRESELAPCDREIFQFARQIAFAGFLLMMAGGIAMIASSGQTTWEIDRTAYVVMIGFGLISFFIGNRIRLILMKHRHIHLNLFF